MFSSCFVAMGFNYLTKVFRFLKGIDAKAKPGLCF